MKIIIENKKIDKITNELSRKVKLEKGEQYTETDILDLLSRILISEVLDNGICKKHFIKLMKMYYKEIAEIRKTIEEIENEEI